jgi:hypothetical protein
VGSTTLRRSTRSTGTRAGVGALLLPALQVLWTDAEKNRAVRLGEWRAEAPFRGVAGFYINELYSPFPGSQLRAWSRST